MIKTPPIAFTEDNFSAVLSGLKTETRRLSNGSDKPKYNVGDCCYLTEPTQIITAPDQSLYYRVKYFWDEEYLTLEKEITLADKLKIESRKTGIYSKQIARFMLKSFARYWVEITDVRLERLLDITDEAAIAEGIKSCKNIYGEVDKPYYWDYVSNAFTLSDPIRSYISEIEMLYGKAIADSNPWVWVYKFKLTNDQIHTA